MIKDLIVFCLFMTPFVWSLASLFDFAYRRGVTAGINEERLRWRYVDDGDDPEPDDVPEDEETNVIDLVARRNSA